MSRAVFLSYSSHDADAARRVCDALRAIGIEVWFDQSELRGGDAWDASIRRQIRECALFVPIISADTNARAEGYFRLEWKLAVDRSHLMADDQPFLVPLAIDDTGEATARVPDRFRERQWSRLGAAETPDAFAGRIRRLLSGDASAATPNAPSSASTHPSAPAAPAEAAPSIAVLPFANRSSSVDDEYFSDGLADELLNVLTKIRGLRVAARTSAFAFKGKQATVAEIGRALNVAAVLEGSVRKSGNRARISVQLVKVADGYHLWSDTYDRTLDDIFAVQDDIAQAVVKELRVALLGEAAPAAATGAVRDEVALALKGRSANGEAHRLLLQGRFLVDRMTDADFTRGVEYLQQAVTIDPGYALAWAALSRAHSLTVAVGGAHVEEAMAKAREAADRALAIEPDLAEGHLARATIMMVHDWNWREADASLRRALALAPANAEALGWSSVLAYIAGRTDEAIAHARRAVAQDPLNSHGYAYLGRALAAAGDPAAAEQACRKALEVTPDGVSYRGLLAHALDRQGRHAEALAEVMKEKTEWARLTGIGVLNASRGRRDDSDRALAALTAGYSDDCAYQIATIHAARGETEAALGWLERAYAQRDAGMALIRVTAEFRPLHAEPRFVALVAKMGLAE